MNPPEGPWRNLPGDILLELLKYFERRRQWPFAGICVSWRAVVLELLGKNVDTALELLYMICRLNTERTAFRRSLRRKDWSRSQSFRLTIVNLHLNSDLVNADMIDDLWSLASTRLPILPNLRNAIVTDPKDRYDRQVLISKFLLCPSLRGFGLLDAQPEGSIMKLKRIYFLRTLFHDIVDRAKDLKFFKLTLIGSLNEDKNRTLEDAVQWLVRRLPKLQIINASPSVLTSKVIEALSKNTELHTVVATPARRDRHDHVPSESTAAHSDFYGHVVLDAGSFAHLKRHTIISSLPADGVLNQPNFPSRQLTELTLLATGACKHSDQGDDYPNDSTQAFIDNAVTESCVRNIASTCPGLIKLDIDMSGSYAWPEEQFNDIPLHYAHLEPLQSLTLLRELYLRDKRGVALTEIELLDLVRPLCCLEVLYICPEPHPVPRSTKSPVSLLGKSTIDRMVETLPKLRVLALYITIVDEYENRRLRSGHARLDLLHLGHSKPPPDSFPPDAFVKYLSAEGRLAVGPRDNDRWSRMGEDIREDLNVLLTGWSRMIGYMRYRDELTMHTPDLA